MTDRPNLLVVCGRNKKRSRTAEYIFKNDNRFNIRSVGLSPKSNRKISAADLTWADLIFVMDNEQRTQVREKYRTLDLSPIEVLHIKDVYEFMDKELITLLTDSINSTLQVGYKI